MKWMLRSGRLWATATPLLTPVFRSRCGECSHSIKIAIFVNFAGYGCRAVLQHSWGAIDATRLSFAGIMQAKIFDLNIIFESSNYLWNLSPIYETFHRRAASFASQINIMISLFWPPVSKPPHPALSLKKLFMIALADAPGRQVTPINLSLKLHNHSGSIRYVHWFSLHQFFSAPSPLLFPNLFISVYHILYFHIFFLFISFHNFDLALRSIWGISEFQSSGSDLQVWWEKLKNHASLEDTVDR